ncbi:MAG: thiF [Verrucomicrobia bacterium]|nr:thiF [Verrucomicrobiota bacterium]
MFELTSSPIDPAALRTRLAAPEAGALTVFEGRVRNHHQGRPVARLEYEAFDEMARLEGEAIVAESENIHAGATVLCVHRTGTLQIGEIAVWIGVASAHRQTGFAACRHVIEELKLRLPIWKKEHHPDGASEWVNCTVEAGSNAAGDDTHARQVALPEIGPGGQARLAAARVLIVGLGGLGCPAALYLAGSGIGHLTLVDGGKVERSNLARQILFTTAEIGGPKVVAAAARLRLHHPAGRISAHAGDLTAGNARTLVAGQDVVLDCSDNFATRFVLHDACLALGVPLVQAAVHRFEGTLDVFQRGAGGCLHCLWPGRPAAELDFAGNCDGAPVFGPAVGVLGVMQAAEAIKLVLGLEGLAPRQTRLVNLLDGTQLAIERPVRADCPVCARLDQLKAATEQLAASDAALLIDAADVSALGLSARVIFLTEPGDDLSAPGMARTVPAHDLARLRELAADGPLVLACRHGLRSAALARMLRAEGMGAVRALAGGNPPAGLQSFLR